MTPRGKKVLIISISLLAIGGVVGYIFWKKAKDKKDAQTKADADKLETAKTDALSSVDKAMGDLKTKLSETPKTDVKPKDEKPIVNASGFLAGDELVSVAMDGAKVLGIGLRYGKSYSLTNAKFIKDTTAGYIQIIGRVKNDKTGNYSNDTLVSKASFWKKKPVVAVAPSSTYGGTGW
jgi:hypothetical protein